MNNWVYSSLFVVCVLISAFSQVLLKNGANKGYVGLRIYLNKYVIIGYSLFLLVTFGTVSLYRYIKLSTGALLESLAYIFIPILSALLLQEKTKNKTLLGIGFVLCGVVIYAIWGGI